MTIILGILYSYIYYVFCIEDDLNEINDYEYY